MKAGVLPLLELHCQEYWGNALCLGAARTSAPAANLVWAPGTPQLCDRLSFGFNWALLCAWLNSLSNYGLF